MADELLIFDAAGSNIDGSDPGSPLQVGSGTDYGLMEASFPGPPLNVQFASSVDTEGEIPVSRRYGNRTVTIRLEMAESGAVDTLLDALQQKFAKLQREGGTLKRTRKDGSSVRIYDIVAGEGWEPAYDFKYVLGNVSEVTMQLPARPVARAAEQDLGDNTETTLPVLVFTEASVPGDVDALGRLVIDNDGSVSWWGLYWGIQSRYYDSASSAALFYEAESRTAMGGSATAAGPSGASGSGSNVMRNTSLLTTYQAILSTQASGGGAHFSHVGTFTVLARVQVPTSNTGTVSVALEWAEGDFGRFNRNTEVSLTSAMEGSWRLLDLGLVSVSKVASGTQRWEGRILAKSTVSGDDIDIDTIELIPADEGSGRAEAVATLPAATSISGLDDYAGLGVGSALNARVASTGGTWATSGSATDFAGHAGFSSDGFPDMVRRAATGTRFAVLGSTNYTATAVASVAVTSLLTNSTEWVGVLARYVDGSNYVALRCGRDTFAIDVVVAGATNTIASKTVTLTLPTYGRLMFTASAAGDLIGYLYNAQTGVLLHAIQGSHAAAATGGAVATGKPGLIDFGSSASGGPFDHFYDDYVMWVPPTDAGVFPGQSLQVRHDGVIREDSAGTVWQPVSLYEGDYLRPPASGAEARTSRVIVRPIYHPGADGVYLDDRIDDMSARLHVTGRFL